jgi:hypothetical protein
MRQMAGKVLTVAYKIIQSTDIQYFILMEFLQD